MAGRVLAWDAHSKATCVRALLMSLNVDRESLSNILIKMRSETFSLLDRLSACMVLARF